MPDNGMTGLTGLHLGSSRTGGKPSRPVRPVRKQKLTAPDGSDGYIEIARARTARKAANPSDPSGAGTTAGVVREAKADVYHLAASRRIRIGYIICGPGEALCGTLAALQPSLDTLFAAAVTCWMCAGLAERDGILIDGMAS
jgi:hypothetical protein